MTAGSRGNRADFLQVPRSWREIAEIAVFLRCCQPQNIPLAALLRELPSRYSFSCRWYAALRVLKKSTSRGWNFRWKGNDNNAPTPTGPKGINFGVRFSTVEDEQASIMTATGNIASIGIKGVF
ncbi:hypothetical protein LQV05_006576 [Cryptococcus neoformans]|nr:hypothetical protein LQV05_006576 [Cryptococcus neoformans]